MTKYEAQAFRAAVGRNLREQRLAHGMTQDELAWQVGVSQGSMSHYEQGKIELPLSVLLEVCRALDVTPAAIVPDMGDGELLGGVEHQAS